MSNSKLLLAILTLCSACGSNFEAGGMGGAAGTSAGATGASGGDTGTAGAPSDAGAPSAAGHANGGAPSAGAGGSNTGGDNAGGSTGGSAGAGTGGHATGGAGGSAAGAGGSAGTDCAALKAEYSAALEKARVCEKGSTTQCDTGSTLPSIGCGCPVLVNSTSAATTLAKQKYQAFQDAKCNTGPICAIACLAYTSAMCSQQSMGTGNVFVCTGSQGVPVN